MSEAALSTAPPTSGALPKLSITSVLPWLLFAALVFAVAVYFLGAEQGATALLKGTVLHEWTHDGRHLLGFPCH